MPFGPGPNLMMFVAPEKKLGDMIRRQDLYWCTEYETDDQADSFQHCQLIGSRKRQKGNEQEPIKAPILTKAVVSARVQRHMQCEQYICPKSFFQQDGRSQCPQA